MSRSIIIETYRWSLSGRLICIFKFWCYSREIIFLLYRGYWRRTRKHFVSILKHEATPTIFCFLNLRPDSMNSEFVSLVQTRVCLELQIPLQMFCQQHIMVYFLTTPIRSAVCMVLCVVFNVYVKQMTIVAKIWLDKKYKKTIGFTWNCFFSFGLPFCQKPHIEAISYIPNTNNL